MSKGIARATLVGNLTRDPELRQLASGTAVCQLSVAVNSSYKDRTGQWVDKAHFFDVVVWGTQGENCARYLAKGQQVAVDGKLEQQTWQANDGTNRSKVQVVAETVIFGPSSKSQPATRETRPTAAKTAANRDDYKDIDYGGTDENW